jgi:hypothetical protein
MLTDPLRKLITLSLDAGGFGPQAVKDAMSEVTAKFSSDLLERVRGRLCLLSEDELKVVAWTDSPTLGCWRDDAGTAVPFDKEIDDILNNIWGM